MSRRKLFKLQIQMNIKFKQLVFAPLLYSLVCSLFFIFFVSCFSVDYGTMPCLYLTHASPLMKYEIFYLSPIRRKPVVMTKYKCNIGKLPNEHIILSFFNTICVEQTINSKKKRNKNMYVGGVKWLYKQTVYIGQLQQV